MFYYYYQNLIIIIEIIIISYQGGIILVLKIPQICLEQVYRTRQHFVCSAKTDTTTPGKLGRAFGFSTRASRAGVGFYTTGNFYISLLLHKVDNHSKDDLYYVI